MTYRPLADVVSNILASPEKNGLSKPLRGSGYLDTGWHAVTIMAVDAERLADAGRITVTLDAGGDVHREAIWLLAPDKSKLSKTFRLLVTGVFNNHAIDYIEYLNKPEQRTYLEALRGMKLSVEIQPGPGYLIHMTDEGYVGVDAASGAVVVGPAANLQSLRLAAEADKLRKSYNKITNVEATDDRSNFDALCNVEAAIIRAPQVDYGAFK